MCAGWERIDKACEEEIGQRDKVDFNLSSQSSLCRNSTNNFKKMIFIKMLNKSQVVQEQTEK